MHASTHMHVYVNGVVSRSEFYHETIAIDTVGRHVFVISRSFYQMRPWRRTDEQPVNFEVLRHPMHTTSHAYSGPQVPYEAKTSLRG